MFMKALKSNARIVTALVLVLAVLLTSVVSVGFAALADTENVSASDAVADDVIVEDVIDDGVINEPAAETAASDTDVPAVKNNTEKNNASVNGTDIVPDVQTVSASDSGTASPYDTEEKETVSAADADILQAEPNIAEGTCGTCSWVIDAEGVLTIYPTDGVSGTLANGTGHGTTEWDWCDYRNDVTRVVVEDGVCTNSNASYLFYGLKCTSMDLRGLDTSNATNVGSMFAYCTAVTELDLSGFDISKATQMGGMFAGCSSLTTIDFTGIDTSSATNMARMFYGCSSLPSLDVTNFDTSNVTNMNNMFYGCSSLPSLDVTNFDTSNVTDMNNMFYGCSSLPSLDVTNFDTSNVTNMSYMFNGCSSLPSLDVTNFDTSNVTNMSYMFSSCRSLPSLDVTNFDTSNVTNLRSIFSNCSALPSIDVTNFDTSNATDMSSIFSNCSALTSIDVTNFDTSNATNIGSMFNGCEKLPSVDVTNFDTSNVTNMSSMFFNCYALKSVDVSGWDTSNVTNMGSMFFRCRALTSLDVTNFDTSNVTNMRRMFEDCRVTALDISSFDTSNVKYMEDMFYSDKTLDTISVSAKFSPASDYEAESGVNFFNVVDSDGDGKGDTLVCIPKTGYAVKTITVDSAEVEPEFDEETGTYTYAGFTGDSKAVIVFAPAWTVIFMDNGVEIDKQIVVQGNDAKDPYADTASRPEMPGYKFVGWSKDFTNVQRNLTVYAMYSYIGYVVAFDANGGEGTMAEQDMIFDSPAKLSKNTFTRDGAEFLGWHTDKDAKTPLYTDEQEVTNIIASDKNRITLYAIWKGEYVDVTVSAAGVGGSVSPESATIPKGRDFEIEITLYNDRCSVASITVNGTAIDLSALSGTGLDRVLTLESVQENTEVVVTFEMESISLGEPKVVFEKESKTFDIGEEIKFTAIGVWPDEYYYPTDGDIFYVPMAWHHAEPSGDWGEVMDPEFDYSASFTQSAAGNYTLKVDFLPLIVDGFSLEMGEIVTVEAPYVVKGEVLGENDGPEESETPKTGDNGIMATVAVNVMIYCAVGMYIVLKTRKKKEN